MVHTDPMHVIPARAAGLDVHKMQITATVRLARPGADAEMRTRESAPCPVADAGTPTSPNLGAPAGQQAHDTGEPTPSEAPLRLPDEPFTQQNAD